MSVVEVPTALESVGARIAVGVVRPELDLPATTFALFKYGLALHLMIELDVIFRLDVPSAEVVVYVGCHCHSPIYRRTLRQWYNNPRRGGWQAGIGRK